MLSAQQLELRSAILLNAQRLLDNPKTSRKVRLIQIAIVTANRMH